jgi:hypothetical protein
MHDTLPDPARVVTPEAFDFVFRNELKRAVRAQNFLTLLVVAPVAADRRDAAAAASHLARIVSLEVRETDLVAPGEDGIRVLLLDTDLDHAMTVVDRLLLRLRHYAFSAPVEVEIGAATCPTHGTDAETLRHAAGSMRPA